MQSVHVSSGFKPTLNDTLSHLERHNELGIELDPFTKIDKSTNRNTIFHEYIRKIVECYIDDIAVKSRDKGNHIANLKRVFDIMRAHRVEGGTL